MAAPIDYVPAKNATAEVIPAGGIVRVVGLDTDTGAFLVDKPDVDGSGYVAVVGMALIPAEGFGQIHFDPRAIAAFDRADGTPAPGETWGARAGSWLLRKGETGFVVTAGAGLGQVNVVRLGGTSAAGSATACRSALAGLDPATDRVTFQVLDGTGLCAEIAAKRLVGYAPDPEVERWVSVGTFPTKLGDTSLTYQYDDATGDPVVTLTGTTGEGSGATTVIQPLKYVGCKNGCEEYAARPLLWCDSAPVTDCEDCPDGAPRRWRFTLAGGTGDFAAANGEWTVVRTTGCEWTATVGAWTATVLTFGGALSVLQLTNGTASAQWVTDLTCCAAWTPALDDISAGEGSTPPDPPTVTAVGPCVREWCADNAFKVRVCCKGHTKYTGCDALPDYSGGWCLYGTNWSSGETLGGTLLGNYGPPSGSGSGDVLYCGVGPGNGYDETRIVCGWRIIGTAESAGDAVSWAALNNVGMWGVNTFAVVVYYDPDAADGAGAWVLGQLNYASFGTECTLNVVATAANDPGPDDDPFEIVFKIPYGVGTYHTLRLAKGPCDEAGGGGSGGEAELDDGCCAGPGEALSGDPPPSLRITILDGAFAGVYDVPYVVGLGGQGGWSATSGGNTWVVYCADADPGPGQIWQVLLNGGGGTVLSVTCSPFGLVVDKSLVGSTADFVVSVTP